MRSIVVAAGVALLALAACSAPPEPAPAAAERVENPELGIAIAALPEAFSVATGSGETITLEAVSETGSGRAVIAAGPEETFGINLVEAVKERKAAFEAAPGGEYFGNRELGTPIGAAFTARGAYDKGSTRVEETWVYAVHPTRNRILTVTYSYPPGQSEERVQHVLELLGEIEGM